ncbi:MAG: hypothetical protein ABEH40_02785 [Haloferacaceae archaeon]
MHGTRLTAVAVVIAALAPIVALAGVVVFGAPPAFRGSIAVSAVVLLVFAADNLRAVGATGSASFASAVVATVLGVWLALAPLTYDAGFAPTALTQFAGLLAAAFSGHTALDAVAAAVTGEPRDGAADRSVDPGNYADVTDPRGEE